MKAPRADDALERRLVSVHVGDRRLHVGTVERRNRAGEVVADGATVELDRLERWADHGRQATR
jgi:hypothetical protein